MCSKAWGAALPRGAALTHKAHKTVFRLGFTKLWWTPCAALPASRGGILVHQA